MFMHDVVLIKYHKEGGSTWLCAEHSLLFSMEAVGVMGAYIDADGGRWHHNAVGTQFVIPCAGMYSEGV